MGLNGVNSQAVYDCLSGLLSGKWGLNTYMI